MNTTIPKGFALIDGVAWCAWTLLDGNTMAGRLVQRLYGSYMVLRVDGTTC